MILPPWWPHYSCRSQRSDYESALTDLESKMDDLDSRLRSVQTSCGYEFTINRMSAVEASQRRLEAAKHRLCTSIKGLISLGMTPNDALWSSPVFHVLISVISFRRDRWSSPTWPSQHSFRSWCPPGR